LKHVDQNWKAKVSSEGRAKEWEYYLQSAKSSDLCKTQKKVVHPQPLWKSLMAPLNGPTPNPTQILARAPVRLWNGLFSVRLSVTVGDKVLNGRFLIDSSVRTSMLSPSWLESQGILPALVLVPGVPPERVTFGGAWNLESESALAPLAWVEKVELAGLALPMNEFLLFETDFFSPPENVGSCCDGVLGNDFFKTFPMQFKSSTPTEIRVWPRENFHWSSETPWVEVSKTNRGTLMTSCAVTPDSTNSTNSKNSKSASTSPLVLPGVSWNTGNEESLTVHYPWTSKAEKVKPNSWKISCSSLTQTFEFADSVQALFPSSDEGRTDQSLLASAIPAVEVGAPLLSRGDFTFDLPHGRLWFSPSTFQKNLGKPVDSGLVVRYEIKKGERLLKVMKIRPHSHAQSLIRAGLKPGMTLLQVDGIAADEMDLWDVNRHLSGVYDNVVTLQWATQGGLKIAPLKLRAEGK
jgi:hypothetical protein